ncbi:Circumsporozoite protein [Tetrabaena socialis]|uniref:Circumsporozoite protein n=1 Tax=Tetrabaena socialis TaxID=47790 RepID=A0A2J8AF41_9CHLO|nr:Circumsporozoite protein [Tetrabaena socialis]|eukprot:PNH11141.1 Circumsporozoite protein [Tetrabaena socialis]
MARRPPPLALGIWLPLLLFLLDSLPRHIAAEQAFEWDELPIMPTNLGEVTSGVCRGKKGNPILVVVGQGSLANKPDTDLTLILNLKSKKWYKRAQRPFKGHHHAAVGVGNRLYLIGGFLGNSSGNLQIYDCRKGHWAVGAPMPFASGAGAACGIGKDIIYCTGVDRGELRRGPVIPNCARYNVDTNTWYSDVPNIPYAVHHAAGGSDQKRCYFFGGRTSSGNHVFGGVGYTQIYDPVWSTSNDLGGPPPMQVPRGGMGGAPFLGGKLWLIGGEAQCPRKASCEKISEGRTPDGVYNRIDLYDPVKEVWDETLYKIPIPHHGTFPVEFDGTIHIAGGGIRTGRSESNRCSTVRLADASKGGIDGTTIPAGDGTTTTPAGGGTTTTPAGGGITTIPAGDGTTTIPAGDGTTTTPAGDGTTTIPAGDGTTTTPAGDGTTTTPAGDGTTTIPAGDGTTTIPAGDGTTITPTGKGTAADGAAGDKAAGGN